MELGDSCWGQLKARFTPLTVVSAINGSPWNVCHAWIANPSLLAVEGALLLLGSSAACRAPPPPNRDPAACRAVVTVVISLCKSCSDVSASSVRPNRNGAKIQTWIWLLLKSQRCTHMQPCGRVAVLPCCAGRSRKP
jgi:hypothetical protein